jgi:hypothetical protein
MSEYLRLAPDQLKELAELVVSRLREGMGVDESTRLVDAHAVADAIGMGASWVREHAAELGVVRLGGGPRPRLRFDLEKAVAAWAARSAGERSVAADPAPQAAPPRRRPTATGTNVELLPIRDKPEARRAA